MATTRNEDGVSIRGQWTRAEIDRYLDDTIIPMRLATPGSNGFPLVASHWFLRRGATLWCAVQNDSAVARRIRAHGRCGFEVSGDRPPYYGVRGQAEVALVPEQGADMLRALLKRYLGGTDSDLARWLLSRAADEVALRLSPVMLYSWDFRPRMG